jgi:pilus assembly protein CpaC
MTRPVLSHRVAIGLTAWFLSGWAAAQQPAPPPPASLPAEQGPVPRADEPFRAIVPTPAPGAPRPVGSTPRPTKQALEEFGLYVEQIVDPQNTLDLAAGRSRLMILKQAPKRLQIIDETVAGATVLTPKELSLTGRKVGTTTLTLFFPDPLDPNKDKVLSYLVRVVPDPELKERLGRVYQELEREINEAFPDSAVQLRLVGDKLVLSGQAKDIADAYQMLRVVRANAPGQQGGPANIPVTQLNVTVPPEAVAAAVNADLPPEQGLANFLVAGGPNVINQLRVAGEQQVMLKVTVAEVNRAAARSIGVNFAILNQQLSISNLTGGLLGSGAAGGSAAGGASGGASVAGGSSSGGTASTLNNIPVLINGGQVSIAINALRNLNLARSLAEPNLVTLNGRAASFQAGGEFPIPQSVITGSGAAQSVQFVPFGVSVNFTPIITDKDRIRLNVHATVSARDFSQVTTIGNSSITSLSTRTFQSTVEMREGQTLAVAGLLQTNFGSDATRIPFLGDLPVAGHLFGFDRTSCSEQELVMLVTPVLVHPLDKKEVPELPGSDLIPPGDLEF